MNFSNDTSLSDTDSAGTAALREAFTAHLVVPDIIAKMPERKLIVDYSDHVSVELGNLVMPEYVSD